MIDDRYVAPEIFFEVVGMKVVLQIGFVPIVLSFGSLCLHDSLVAISTFANFVFRFNVRPYKQLLSRL